MVRGLTALPPPVAMMTGPSLTGPATTINASESWGIDIPYPSTPDLVWVIVSSSWFLATASGNLIGGSAGFHFLGQGDGGNGVSFLYDGGTGDLQWERGAETSFNSMMTPEAMRSKDMSRLWIVTPPGTFSGTVYAHLTVTAGSGGTVPNDTVFCNLAACRLLGYPVGYYDSGALMMGGF